MPSTRFIPKLERIAMSSDQQRQFPGWDAMYQQQAIETMPWFYPELDDDLRQALDRLGLWSGEQMHSVTETVYQGTLDPLPRALFCVLQQKENTP
jgi:hypothetical protein